MKQLIAICVVALTLASCMPKNEPAAEDGKPLIVCTTGMVGDAIKNIVGDKATVKSLMGPGVDPHLYKPKAGDLDLLTEADAIFYSGLYLEGKMEDVLEKFGEQKPVYAIGSELNKAELLPSADYEDQFDPHMWHDVMLWADAVYNARKYLQETFPENADYFEVNSDAYIDTLVLLNSWVEEALTTIPENNRMLVTSHDAFEYFGKAYNMEVRGVQGVSTVMEAGLQDITQIVDMLIADSIPAVFVESSVSEKNINAIIAGCQDQGHDLVNGGTLYSDALGADDTQAGTYVGMIRANITTITNALR